MEIVNILILITASVATGLWTKRKLKNFIGLLHNFGGSIWLKYQINM